MVFKKQVTKTPAVMVETRKISTKDTCGCGVGCCAKFKHVFVFALVVINTLLLIRVLCNQSRIEADRVGGMQNYKMVKQIYQTEAFKTAQQQQIQQALQMYQGGAQQVDQQAAMPATNEQPIVTQ